MKFIKTKMKLDQQSGHAENRQTEGQTGDVDKGICLVFIDVANRGFEVA
jgi:hypothetical protein